SRTLPSDSESSARMSGGLAFFICIVVMNEWLDLRFQGNAILAVILTVARLTPIGCFDKMSLIHFQTGFQDS
ncbi:hypothetical protein ACFQWB_14470, partial [Paenibacillus thermoaerophilus]